MAVVAMKRAAGRASCRPLLGRHTARAWAVVALGLAGLPMAAAVHAEGPTVTISTNNTPLDRKALELVAKEAFHRVGVEFKLVSLPSERSLRAANLGEIDGEGLRVAGLEQQYPNLVRVPERVVGISFVAFARDASIALDRRWESLQPYRVAFINGWKMFEANATGARIVRKVDKPEQLFEMLEHEHVDLALYTRADGAALVKRMGYTSIAAVEPALQDVDMYLYLNRRHEALVPRLADAIRAMKVYGSYNRLIARLASD